MDTLANIVGLIGTSCVVGAYVFMQLDKIDPKGLAYNVINLIGAILLLLSLMVHFNLASVVIEFFWIGASFIGIYQYYKRRKTRS